MGLKLPFSKTNQSYDNVMRLSVHSGHLKMVKPSIHYSFLSDFMLGCTEISLKWKGAMRDGLTPDIISLLPHLIYLLL